MEIIPILEELIRQPAVLTLDSLTLEIVLGTIQDDIEEWIRNNNLNVEIYSMQRGQAPSKVTMYWQVSNNDTKICIKLSLFYDSLTDITQAIVVGQKKLKQQLSVNAIKEDRNCDLLYRIRIFLL